jgi:outer membrane protein assembly factor BamB
MPRRAPVFAALLLAAAPAWAAQPQFWRTEGARDFLDGETEGVSVDSDGHVRLAPASRLLHDPEAPNVWALAAGPKGVFYAGTGNEGKVFKIDAGKGSLFFDAPELEVHALALGPDGRLYAATSPDGKVYVLDATGKATTFFDPEEKYIWALAFDRQGRLLVATGGEGKVYRVDAKGKAETILNSAETHILSLAVDEKGNVFAGSAPSGILYRIEPSKKVFVLLDSPFREVKAIAVGPDGGLYLALVDGKTKDEVVSRPAVPGFTGAAAGAPAGGEVTISETFALPPPSAPAGNAARTVETATGAPRGAVVRVSPSGEIDTLWSSAEETAYGLVHAGDGVLVATGNRGKVYRVRDDRSWDMVCGFSAEQITAIGRGPEGSVFLASSNPGRVYALDAMSGARGTFVSKVKDSETVSSWGRLSWEAVVPAGTEIQVQTRSGNTSSPDATWSDWSLAYLRKEGAAVTSEPARFLQVKTTLLGKAGASPVLDSVTAAYLQRNLRPQVQSVTVHPPGEVFQKPLSVGGEMEILGLDAGPTPERGGTPAMAMPPAVTFSRKMYQRGIQTFSWKADDANGDALLYDVSYRSVADARFRPLRKGLTDAVLAWDTSTVPNGRYVVKITASDAPANPPALALGGERESLPFDVDNTPPTLTATLVEASPVRVRAVARDDSSLIRRAESSVDGGRWEEIRPVDGINDSLEETYELRPEGLAKPGPHLLVLRVFDLLGNAATARVEIP